jgi:subfamily B ATP-binding cassette protein MsbA
VLKGICDYAGTYLVNYAGFGMITDLRNDLYDSILQRSAAFFHKHTTGTLVSTIVNDVERVQYAMSSVLAEFLQQFFTFLFTALVVVALGRKFAWILVLFVPAIIFSAASAAYDAARAGQAGGHSEYSARDHHRQPYCEGVQHGALGDCAIPKSRAEVIPR